LDLLVEIMLPVGNPAGRASTALYPGHESVLRRKKLDHVGDALAGKDLRLQSPRLLRGALNRVRRSAGNRLICLRERDAGIEPVQPARYYWSVETAAGPLLREHKAIEIAAAVGPRKRVARPSRIPLANGFLRGWAGSERPKARS